jgi:LmbE family N-acetylglucosaminyl deacetylase
MKEALRHLCHRVFSQVLKLRSRPLPLIQDGRCVIIAPHQDDEALGCAGLIQRCNAAGIPVAVIYITDGAGSHPEHPRHSPPDIAQLRRAEASQAMKLLGLSPDALHFLDAADGTLAHLSSEIFTALSEKVATLLVSLRPASIFLPCRDDGSSEHVAAFRLAQHALTLAHLAPRLFEYPVWARWSPRLLIRTSLSRGRIWRVDVQAVHDLKRRALAAYVSQFQPTPPWTQSVLPPGFAACFLQPEEFFIER